MKSCLILNYFQSQRVQLVHFHVHVRMVVCAQQLALKYVHVQMVLLAVFVKVYYVDIIFTLKKTFLVFPLF